MLKAAIRIILFGILSLQIGIGSSSDDASTFAARREALMKKIEGSIAVLAGAPQPRAYTAFRQENNFYYLSGVEVPGAYLLIDGIRNESLLFLPARDKALERWEGRRLYPGSDARKQTGMETLEVSELAEVLEKRITAAQFLYSPMTPGETAADSRDRAQDFEMARQHDPWDGRTSREAAFEKNLQARFKSAAIRDLSPLLDGMRRVKDAQEIDRLREAGRIGALGIREAMRSAKPGVFEYQLAATAQFIFSWHGASGFAFFPIVGSGPNSCLVHYNSNNRQMQPGDLVVMDFGPDYRYYVSDITRTFPVSGRFTAEQAEVYRIVLDAHKAALEKTKPGATFGDLADAVRNVLDRYAYSRFLTHAVAHYVGMSTHDVGPSQRFEPGVVIAVEPGVYFPDRKFGVRIEDTVLVTAKGYEILTKEAPWEIADIEKLMNEKSLAEAVRE